LNPNSEDSHNEDIETNSRAPLKNIDKKNSTIDRRYRWPVRSKKRTKRQSWKVQKKEAHKSKT
jgi:hypothetical protein